ERRGGTIARASIDTDTHRLLSATRTTTRARARTRTRARARARTGAGRQIDQHASGSLVAGGVFAPVAARCKRSEVRIRAGVVFPAVAKHVDVERALSAVPKRQIFLIIDRI